MTTKDKIIQYIGALDASFLTHPSLDAFVDMEMSTHKESVLKHLYIPAIAYIVAHKISVLKLASSGTSGLITKEKLGDQEIQYSSGGSGSKDTPFYTVYYQEYKRLISSIVGNFNA